MQVFKLSLRIVNKYRINMLVMIVITFALSVVFVKSSESTGNLDDEKVRMTIVDLDKSEASKALTKFMEKKNDVKDVDEDTIQDALYYKEITYVLYIPKGYETAITENQDIVFDKKELADSASGYIVDKYATDFSDTMQSHYHYGKDATITSSAKQTNKDLMATIEKESLKSDTKQPMNLYFNFLSYSFVSCIIWAVGFVMLSMNRVDIKRRNTVSPISNLNMNIQLCLGALAIGAMIFMLGTVFAYMIFASEMNVLGSFLYIVNLAVWLVPCLALAYLISSLCTKLEVLSGITNILCLALAFLGGAFVPQMMMGDVILNVAHFVPSYWFVNANNQINELTNLGSKQLQPIFEAMGIQLIFGAIFFAIALLISKKRSKNII